MKVNRSKKKAAKAKNSSLKIALLITATAELSSGFIIKPAQLRIKL
jgi:hypothetical protein